MTSDFFRVVNEARANSLGPFSPRFNIQTSLMEGLEKFLPEDAHTRVNGKLHISLTRVYDGKNVIVSQFNSRDELLQALLCACFIPGFSGILPPRFHGVRYMDGAFSDNLPTLDENTVTVSPFCGESDICPRDNSAQMFHVSCHCRCHRNGHSLSFLAGQLGQHEHRAVQAEHESLRAHSLPTKTRDSVQHVPAGLR